MKIRIYVLCYDERTQMLATQEYGDKQWAKVLYIKTTPLLENVMYDEWFLENHDDWKDFDYIGTISWKASQKITLPNMQELSKLLDQVQYDIIVFNAFNFNLLEQATFHHPKFKSIWVQSLQLLGFSTDDSLNSNIQAFFCNYWITKPHLMLKYINFFKKIKHIMDTAPEIQNDLWDNPMYGGNTLSEEKMVELYNKPYIPYHVFIYERMPCFFFWHKKAKILLPNHFPWLYVRHKD